MRLTSWFAGKDRRRSEDGKVCALKLFGDREDEVMRTLERAAKYSASEEKWPRGLLARSKMVLLVGFALVLLYFLCTSLRPH